MAQRVQRPAEGETRFGSGIRPGVQGALHIQANAGANRPSVLFLDAVNDQGAVTTYALWVDQTGDLRIKAANDDPTTTVIANEDSDGAVVGGQS